MLDKTLLYPPFAKKLIVFEARLEHNKLPFYGFCGKRSFEQQAAEYAKGRTIPGNIVTKARPGYSFHQYGVAADYVEDGMIEKPGIQWSWDLANDINKDGVKDWQQMGNIARDCGLDSAMFWKTFPEGPHIQLAGLPKVEGLLALYTQGGLPAVWAALDKVYL
jgi:peptidoglycan LD-endopeptidase CwlK